ncbi:hypothetical protein [Sphingobium sp. AP50]|uniref:hypothetical protein n=1 Tax=Sphingobium sp. AP50 TaxID=1884369 RepID=UPI0011605CB8|nr:hypothetical protein [Sphingobium sp. AP50]
MMTEGDFIGVWQHAYDNHNEIRRSNSCRCLGCRERFAPSEICRWIVTSKGDRKIFEGNPVGKRDLAKHASAFCPYCDEQYVIGDASGYPLNDAAFIAQVFSVGPRIFFDGSHH